MNISRRGDFGIAEKLKQIERQKANIKDVLGVIAVEHFKHGFDKSGGQTDASVGGWKKRKNDKTPSRGVLVKTGSLRDSITHQIIGNKIKIYTRGNVYGAIHNFGLRGTAWGRHSFTMPKREFIGHSRVLNRKLANKIEREFLKIIR